MLDYKNIIIKHYALSLSGSEIARQLGASKSGVNDFLRAFDKCESLSYPLPPGITNYGIAELVYGSVPGSGGRNENIEYNIITRMISILIHIVYWKRNFIIQIVYL